MREPSVGSIQSCWKSSPSGEPLIAVNDAPPSVERYSAVSETYTRSGFFGSTATWQKYQPRPHRRGSASASFQFAPASSLRYSPPAVASTIA